MDNHFTNSLLFVWLYCWVSAIGTCATNCSSIEKEALNTFKQGLSDPSGRLISSWIGENCCEWPGVTCDFITGRVTKIDLRNSLALTFFDSPCLGQDCFFDLRKYDKYKKTSLGGDIHASLLELRDLNYLDLSFNDFEGTPIPHFFGMLTNLRYLNLSSANFGGEIPLHLGNLSNLKYLDLSSNFLYPDIYRQKELDGEGITIANLRIGNDFKWLSDLSALKYLDMGGVDLSIAQPNWMHVVNTLSSLIELHLSQCLISSFDITSTGFLNNLTSLEVLDLSFNQINFPLSPWLSNITTLTKLDLKSNDLEGTIPQDYLKLKNLQYFDISWNKLGNNGDPIPSSLRNLCKLQFLNMAINKFGGNLDEFLDSFSNCSHDSLETLDLSYNKLVGRIPNSLGRFKNLQSLHLSFNQFWGSLPDSIGNLSLLQRLHVSYNHLNGTIPPSFGQLSELVVFWNGENSWEGVLTKAHLVNLTKLKDLVIQTDKKNQPNLVFDLSYDWIPPFRLKRLSLENCLVGPHFPLWLQVQTQIISLTLSNAGIGEIGFIPNGWISNLSSQITHLDLSNNLLKGEVSQLLASYNNNSNLIDGSYNNQNHYLQDSIVPKYPNLFRLYLQKNLLSGPIPSNIGDLMPQLERLYLSENCFNGTMPSSIQNMRYLEVLSIWNNQLSGELVDNWGKMEVLSVIDLANNHIYGKIPSSIGLLRYLNKLMLSNNHLHGEIPKSLQSCSFLDTIDLSKNRLYGSLPSWMGVDVLNLELLNLQSNLLSGTIPRQWCNLSMLRVLDLSNNNLSGEIPSCLYNWTTFTYGNDSFDLNFHRNHDNIYYQYTVKTMLVMKGREFEYNITLQYVLIIDLSRNGLRGEIPNEIIDLVHLTSLNLSHNHLVGIIPANIGAMQQLEALDISNNQLSGAIPTTLSSLHFLQHLNMSFNNLSGRIPTGNQLQTLNDPSIYEGNPLLCGSPLQTKYCPGEKDATTIVPMSTSEENEHGNNENDSEMLGLYISMTIGFLVGLNILFFAIFTSESRRISYLRFVDKVSYNILQRIGFA